MSKSLDDFDPLAGLLGPVPATPKDGDDMAWFKELAANTPPEDLDPSYPGLGAARRVRTDDPRFFPAPPLPYPFDGSNELARAAVLQLAFLPDGSAKQDKDREAAATWLLHAYEARHGTVLNLRQALRFWWLAARSQADIGTCCGFPPGPDSPRRSPNAFFAPLRRAAALDFAAAKRIPAGALRDTLAKAGVALPREKKRKKT